MIKTYRSISLIGILLFFQISILIYVICISFRESFSKYYESLNCFDEIINGKSNKNAS